MGFYLPPREVTPAERFAAAYNAMMKGPIFSSVLTVEDVVLTEAGEAYLKKLLGCPPD